MATAPHIQAWKDLTAVNLHQKTFYIVHRKGRQDMLSQERHVLKSILIVENKLFCYSISILTVSLQSLKHLTDQANCKGKN